MVKTNNGANTALVNSDEKKIKKNPVKALRTKFGWKQTRFALETDISLPTIKKLELGQMRLSKYTKEKIRDAFDLNDDWYVEPFNFEPKQELLGDEKTIWSFIMNGINDKEIAKDIFFSLKEVIKTNGLNAVDKQIYIQYIHNIMKDVRIIALSAKKYIGTDEMVFILNNAQKIANDIVNLPGYEVNKSAEHPGSVSLFGINEIGGELRF